MRQQQVLAEAVRQVAQQLEKMGEQNGLLKVGSSLADLQRRLGRSGEFARAMED